MPELGLKIIWSAIIPLAPLIFFLIPNIWTSMCPLSSFQVLPDRLGLKRPPYTLSDGQIHRLRILSWVLLFIIVPARHLVLNTNATLLALTIMATLLLASVLGLTFKGLSGWCTGLCPIRPVEMMYGQFNLESNRPEACTMCKRCNVPCSRLNVHNPGVLASNNARFRYFIYAFPGFVLGYFLVPPASTILSVYAIMALSSLMSSYFFWLVAFDMADEDTGETASAMAIISALCIYYAFTVPGIIQTWGLAQEWTAIFYTLVYSVIALNLMRYWYQRNVRASVAVAAG